MLSSGLKKDILIIMFANALFKISTIDEQEGVVKRESTNKNYKLNKRIDRRVARLQKKCEVTISSIAEEHFTEKVASWFKNKLDTSIGKVLKVYDKKDAEVNLEMLGLWLLFVNFCKRGELKLDEALAFFNDRDLYFDDLDMIHEAGISADTEEQMMHLAYEAIAIIKS